MTNVWETIGPLLTQQLQKTADLEKDLELWKAQSSQKDQIISDKDKKITELNKRISEKDKKITELDKSKDKKIAELSKRILEKDKKIAELNKSKDKQIAELENEIQCLKNQEEVDLSKKRPTPAKPKSYAKRLKPSQPELPELTPLDQPLLITTHILGTKEPARPIRNARICGSCQATSSPVWRPNNGDPAWGDRLCNACHIRQKRKS